MRRYRRPAWGIPGDLLALAVVVMSVVGWWRSWWRSTGPLVPEPYARCKSRTRGGVRCEKELGHAAPHIAGAQGWFSRDTQ